MTLSNTKTQKPFCGKKVRIQLSAAFVHNSPVDWCAETSDCEMASNYDPILLEYYLSQKATPDFF